MQATRVLLSFLVFDTLNNRQSIERTAYMPRGTFGPGDSSSLRLTSDLQYMGGAGGVFLLCSTTRFHFHDLSAFVSKYRRPFDELF